MKMAIRHETTYSYTEPLNYSIQQLRLTPRLEPHQHTIAWEIAAPGALHRFVDACGNITHILTLTQPATQLRIVAEGMVESLPLDRGRLREQSVLSPLVFTVPTRRTQETQRIAEMAHAHLKAGSGTSDFLDLAQAIRGAVLYQSGTTEVTSTAGEALDLGSGVCQDHVHLFIACCIAVGIPARYVSGYIDTDNGAHAASHAWVDVWTDDGDYAGWASIDVTNAIFANEGHCRLAVGRDYDAASPIRGVRRGGGAESLGVDVRVEQADQ